MLSMIMISRQSRIDKIKKREREYEIAFYREGFSY